MATYSVKTPDGATYTIQGDDNADPSAIIKQLMGHHSQSLDSLGDGTTAPTGSAAAKAAQSPTSGMSDLSKYVAGWGQATHSLGQGIGQALGLSSRADVANSRALDAPLLSTGAGKAGAISGSVANVLPTAFVPGANTLGGAAAISGLLGLLQPSTSTGETLQNAGIGAAAGPAGLLAGRAVGAVAKGAKAALWDPFTEQGKKSIASNTWKAFAGGEGPAADAAARLANPPDVLPGVQPTTAELAQNGGLAQLQKTLSSNGPLINDFTQRAQGNRGAIVSAVNDMAGSPGARAAAVDARAAQASPLYDAAKGVTVPVDETLGGLLNRPSMKQAMTRAQSLADEAGDGPIMAEPKGAPVLAPSKLPPKNNVTPDASQDSILEYLAKYKGLNSDEAKAQGFDPANFGDSAAHVGIKRAFRSNGMTFDQAAEHLHEAGYPVTDEFGRYDPNVLMDKIDDELRGDPWFSVHNTRNQLAMEDQHLFDQHNNALANAKPDGPATISGKSLQYLKMGLSDLANSGPQQGMGAHEIRAVKSTLGSLNDWISGNVPELRAADSAYAAASKPINSMDAGKQLAQRLQPALTDFGQNTRLNAQSFANAVRNGDDIAADVTGRQGAKLADVLGANHMDTIRKVGEQLARTANAAELGAPKGSPTAQNLISQNFMGQFLGPLGLPNNMAGRIAASTLGRSMKPVQWIAKEAEPDVLQHLGRAALDPKYAVELAQLAQRNPVLARALWAHQGLLGAPAQQAVQGLLGNSPQ